MSNKLNVLLGRVESLSSQFKASVIDYFGFFTKQQGQFKGIRKTYSARPETIDLPTERQNTIIVATVEEKLAWFIETHASYINNLFEVEATNGCGIAKADLIVDEINFGKFASLELLRLISILESENLKAMYGAIPVRSDAEDWQATDDSLYEGRDVYELSKQSGIKKSIQKEQYILEDPNVDKMKDSSKYTPVVASKDTVQELGDWTLQYFSGEYSHKERAEILRRYSKLLLAAKDALKVANSVVAITSDMTSAKLFGYLHNGRI